MKKRRDILLQLSWMVGIGYAIYSMGMFSMAFGGGSTPAQVFGASVALLLIWPHILFVLLSLIFSFIAWIENVKWAAVTGGIMYVLSFLTLMNMAAVLLFSALLCFVGYHNLRQWDIYGDDGPPPDALSAWLSRRSTAFKLTMTVLVIFICGAVFFTTTDIFDRRAPASATPEGAASPSAQAVVATSTPAPVETDPPEESPISSNIQDTVLASEAFVVSGEGYGPGMYKVGKDLPGGGYRLIADDGDFAYPVVKVTYDANQNEEVQYEAFKGSYIVYAWDGMYLDISDCQAYPLDDTELVADIHDLPPGMYMGEVDIPAGEYKLRADGEASAFSYYVLYTGASEELELEASNRFYGDVYVEVPFYGYLYFDDCRIVDFTPEEIPE